MSNERYCAPGELKRLAAQVVDCILCDEELAAALIDVIERKKPPKPPECPPRTLCCSKNHVCETRTVSFSCTAPFQCSNGHVEKLTQA